MKQQQQFQNQRNREALVNKIGRYTVSFTILLLTQFSLSLIPRFFSTSYLLLQLALSGIVSLLVLGFGKWCRRLLGVNASAPAFVFFTLLFIWSLYFFLIRPGVPFFLDCVFNGEVIMLFIGVCSMLSSDPGYVAHGSSHSDKLVDGDALDVEAHNKDSISLKRVRYCKSCKAYVKGFDHHCPAFGNCIGQNNHVLFMVLLLGFLITEASYIICSFHFIRDSQNIAGTGNEVGLCGSLVIGTMLFTLLQVLWQGFFTAWHVYCICFNIRTDEWINWKKYPEFQVNAHSQPGGSFSDISFTNPYNKGILDNVKEFYGVRE